MIAGLDSAMPPSIDQVRAARASGVRIWSGYLATKPHVNLLRPWSKAEFGVAAECGSPPIAYCSGWDDPRACQLLAESWRVRLCLDVEDGIRGDGAWVQGWLDASGAGVYGNAAVHTRRAAFHVLSFWPGRDPRATWSGPRPGPPCGWQWQGGHPEFGADVDRCWFDDFFVGDQDMTLDELNQALLANGIARPPGVEQGADPGWYFGAPPSQAPPFAWCWQLVADKVPQFGATPAQGPAYSWEWAWLETPGDLTTAPGFIQSQLNRFEAELQALKAANPGPALEARLDLIDQKLEALHGVIPGPAPTKITIPGPFTGTLS